MTDKWQRICWESTDSNYYKSDKNSINVRTRQGNKTRQKALPRRLQRMRSLKKNSEFIHNFSDFFQTLFRFFQNVFIIYLEFFQNFFKLFLEVIQNLYKIYSDCFRIYSEITLNPFSYETIFFRIFSSQFFKYIFKSIFKSILSTYVKNTVQTKNKKNNL